MWIVSHALRVAWIRWNQICIFLENSPEGISCPELTPPELYRLHFSLCLRPYRDDQTWRFPSAVFQKSCQIFVGRVQPIVWYSQNTLSDGSSVARLLLHQPSSWHSTTLIEETWKIALEWLLSASGRTLDSSHPERFWGFLLNHSQWHRSNSDNQTKVFINNTITDGGSTAPLYCWYHTEEKTIQEYKRDWKDVRGIVGRR